MGDFVLAPLDGAPSRDFQALHFDFGLPLQPKAGQDVARYTALPIPQDFGQVSAVTRIVPLAKLLAQRAWPPTTELLSRLISYGKSHGPCDDTITPWDGSLACVVDAATGSCLLPSVMTAGGFLCGLEFDSLRAEFDFFARHSLSVE